MHLLITGWAAAGYVGDTQVFWKEGCSGWEKLADVPELADAHKALQQFKEQHPNQPTGCVQCVGNVLFMQAIGSVLDCKTAGSTAEDSYSTLQLLSVPPFTLYLQQRCFLQQHSNGAISMTHSHIPTHCAGHWLFWAYPSHSQQLLPTLLPHQ